MNEQAGPGLGCGEIGLIGISHPADGVLQVELRRPHGSELPRYETPETTFRFDATTGAPLAVTEYGAGIKFRWWLLTLHDAWFADVSTEWRRANQAIREHDLQYWKTRSPPDPRTLVPEFLRPPAGKAKQTGPIDVLRQVPGYWQYPANADRW